MTAQEIRKRRMAVGLSQTALAKLTGISRFRITTFESITEKELRLIEVVIKLKERQAR
jgi:predicted transcriptional regulator